MELKDINLTKFTPEESEKLHAIWISTNWKTPTERRNREPLRHQVDSFVQKFAGRGR
ncbi:MAG: hypothetical protein NC390_02585 [Fusobacterium sp.]|nr:hypothetical protein [Fusobacterium sp.]